MHWWPKAISAFVPVHYYWLDVYMASLFMIVLYTSEFGGNSQSLAVR